uniref:Uncharacterized protein n=1 Tax=Ditylenchus dipsaci TaxID=166011 RepID=A0A915D6Z4_9BILA
MENNLSQSIQPKKTHIHPTSKATETAKFGRSTSSSEQRGGELLTTNNEHRLELDKAGSDQLPLLDYAEWLDGPDVGGERQKSLFGSPPVCYIVLGGGCG